MLKLSKLTDYAVVVLVRLSSGEMQTSAAIATATAVPEPTVAKVLKALAAAHLVVSTRGAHGGYRVSKPLEAISVADVIAAVDGPIALTACVDGSHSACDVSSLCAVRGRWDLVNDAIHTALSAISLADMRDASVPPAFRLHHMLPMPATHGAE